MQYSRDGLQYDMTVKGVAEEFEYSEEHIRYLVKKKGLPHIKRGREYRFNREKVEEALLSLGREPVEDSERRQSEPDIDEYDIDLGI